MLLKRLETTSDSQELSPSQIMFLMKILYSLCKSRLFIKLYTVILVKQLFHLNKKQKGIGSLALTEKTFHLN